ncbi:hypothetical protein [Streptomyces sp. SS8]
MTGTEHSRAVEQWLLSALDEDRQGKARAQWAETGVALLPCGRLFAAVRLPAGLVHAAARSAEPETVTAYLRRALCDGPVFVDTCRWRYYALVPVSVAHRWLDRDAECLSTDSYLGVPRPDLTLTGPGPGRASWVVPMGSPGELCTGAAVAQLVSVGRHRQMLEGEGEA